MGQLFSPSSASIILTAVDRLIAINADGGMSPNAAHVVAFGENAARNLGDVDYIYVIGADSLSAGLIPTSSEGTAIYGAKVLTALTNAFPAPIPGPVTALGYNIAPNSRNRVGSSVLIGSNIATAQDVTQNAPIQASVLIGNEVGERHSMWNGDGGNFNQVVLIGWRACRGKVFFSPDSGASLQSSVIIGSQACQNVGNEGPGNSLTNAVIIGQSAAPSIAGGIGDGAGNDVLIGPNVAINYSAGTSNVAIGSGITMGQRGQNNNVIIGSNSSAQFNNNTKQNVMVGSFQTGVGMGSLNVLIGSGANGVSGPSTTKQLVIEIADDATGVGEALIYGDFNLGNLVIGNTVLANRDLPGTNILKLINGTYSGAPPVGGGLFYYDAATGLHFVGAAGTDTVIAPP